MSGSTITTSNGTLAMSFTSGVHLRLDASTTVRVESATDLAIERGAVYVDSGNARPAVDLLPGTPAPRPAGIPPISVHTTSGIVRDIGTRFEVRLVGAGIRIRVRDGQVRLTDEHGADVRADAGEELFSRPDGSDRSINRRPIAAAGSEWEWVERAAPPFSMEGKTLGELLDWVSREGAWTVTFADRGFSQSARATVIHGRPDQLKGMTVAEVLDVVLRTCGLRHRIDHDRVVIEREPGGGAAR
jgi:ferric-dicitrate binding protein FerR (iron transport regulator)